MAELFSTERLTVRNFTPADADDLAGFLTDPEVCYFEPYEPFTKEACVQEAVMLSESNELFAIELNGKVIGKIFFAERQFGSYEIGYTLNREYQGMGYALESVRSMMEYAFRELGVRRIFAEIDTRNEHSRRLAERLGMRREAEHKELVPRKGCPGVYNDFYIYAMLSREMPESGM